jgi:hypothetical protein
MRNRTLHIFLVLFLFLVSVAGIQGAFRIFRETELTGGRGLARPARFEADSIFSGAFQDQTIRYLNDRTGFRSILVRMNSQLDFSLFRVSPFRNVLVGRNHYLFEPGYIDSYLGRNYTGAACIASELSRLRIFQEALEKHHVHFLLVLCPSKARFMPENLPAPYRSASRPSNYDVYLNLLARNSGVTYIDLNHWFLEMKDTSRYTLYPHGGNHWTTFSARSYVLDTLLRAMERLSGNHYPRIVNDRIWWTDSLASPDDDLSVLLNLVCPFPSETLPYSLAHADSAGCTKPGVLVIGDSYFWQIYGYKRLSDFFRECDFWAWNEDFYPLYRYRDIPQDHYLFYRHEILRHEFVILMVTEINLVRLLNFDEKTYPLFDPAHSLAKKLAGERKERIEFYRHLILADPKWRALILKKAETRNISFRRMLDADAAYMAENEIQELQKD